MPPINPCARVVDYMRSCFAGYWRFFPASPWFVTEGFHYWADADTPTINGPHSFGSAVWNKDGLHYPTYPTGQDISLGQRWIDGNPPDVLPPSNQIGTLQEFASDLEYDPLATPDVQNGFDARCYVVPGVDLDLNSFFKPDIIDCCWQRVLAQFLSMLETPGDVALGDFEDTIKLLWRPDEGYTVRVAPRDTTRDRIAWVNGPTFQIVFSVGTQDWSELWNQLWHGLTPPTNVGNFATERPWFDRSTAVIQFLMTVGFDANKAVTFVGHSKGAAVLWILARRIADFQPGRDVEVLTFGCPKVGDDLMIGQGTISKHVHVIHEQDVVPLIPPNAPLGPLLANICTRAQLDAFRQWRNFPSYVIVGGGGGPRMGQADDLPWQTYAAWIRQLFRRQVPEPIAQHRLPSYVSALQDCCDEPHFPFTEQLWAKLFGFPDFGGGGMFVMGGKKFADDAADGGVKVSGKGVSFGVVGGVALGDSGRPPSTAVHGVTLGGVHDVLRGLGGVSIGADFPTPGSSCATALDKGDQAAPQFIGMIPAGKSQWFVFLPDSWADWGFNIFALSAPIVGINVYQGTACGSLELLGTYDAVGTDTSVYLDYPKLCFLEVVGGVVDADFYFTMHTL